MLARGQAVPGAEWICSAPTTGWVTGEEGATLAHVASCSHFCTACALAPQLLLLLVLGLLSRTGLGPSWELGEGDEAAPTSVWRLEASH